MMERTYRLKYILTGSSGSGKSTMASILEQELGLRRCITSTTRPPRPGETDGIDYFFTSQFNPDEMFEHASFGGHKYGVSKEELTHGDFIILEPQGVDFYRKNFPGPLTVIQLVREGIAVDPARAARDQAAGFDQIHPDHVVSGETIEEMSHNLIRVITQDQHPLFKKIACAQTRAGQQNVAAEAYADRAQTSAYFSR